LKVLIVGSGGFVGSRLARRLEAGGATVAGISSRDGTGIRSDTGRLPPDFSIEPETEVVVYLATSPHHRGGSSDPRHLFAVNTQSAIVCAEAARRTRARRFIYASTGNVYAPSFEPLSEAVPLRRDDAYALSKLHAEEALALFRPSMEVIVARLFGVYGPGQRARLVPDLIASVLASRPIRLLGRPGDRGKPDGLRLSLGYIDDVLSILVRLVERGGPPYLNVAGPEVVSVRQLAEAVGGCVARPPLFDCPGVDREFDLIASVALLRRELNPPFTPFAEGLARTVAEYPRAEA
jgi:nucleoside-diphosphate-sugar epimerase